MAPAPLVAGSPKPTDVPSSRSEGDDDQPSAAMQGSSSLDAPNDEPLTISPELNTTHQASPAQLIKLDAKLNGIKITVLVDCGASDDFLSAQFVQRYGLASTTDDPLTVTLADGSQLPSSQTASKAYLRIGRYHDKLHFNILPLSNCDLILGKRWLESVNPQIDWRQNTLTFQHRGETVMLKSRATVQPRAPNSLLSALQLQRAVKKGSRLGFRFWG